MHARRWAVARAVRKPAFAVEPADHGSRVELRRLLLRWRLQPLEFGERVAEGLGGDDCSFLLGGEWR